MRCARTAILILKKKLPREISMHIMAFAFNEIQYLTRKILYVIHKQIEVSEINYLTNVSYEWYYKLHPYYESGRFCRKCGNYTYSELQFRIASRIKCYRPIAGRCLKHLII